MPSMWMAAALSFAMFATFAGVIFSITSSFAASSRTGSSIITTERYGLVLFETIFSRFTSDLVPSKMILQPYFFSNIGMTVGSMNALWLAAPPMTSSFGWLRTMAGTPSVDTVAAAPTVRVRNCRRVTRSSVIAASSRSESQAPRGRVAQDEHGGCHGRITRPTHTSGATEPRHREQCARCPGTRRPDVRRTGSFVTTGGRSPWRLRPGSGASSPATARGGRRSASARQGRSRRERIVGRPQDLVRPDVVGEDAQAAFDGLERDPAVALEQVARPHRQPGVVEALVVEVTVHAVEPRRDPSAARFQERDPHARMAIADAFPDDAHGGEHHFHRVRDDVLRAPRGEAVDADLGHAAAGALVQPDREVELLDFAPEGLVVRVVQHAAVVRIGPQEPGAHAELLPREAHLCDGQRDRLHRQHRDAEETVRVGLAVIGQPAVVRPAHRRGEARLGHRAREEADARVEKRGVDAVEIHVRNPRVRVETAPAALDILHGALVDHALPGPDGADDAEALRAAEDLALYEQAFLAVGVDDDPGRAIPEARVDVLVPQVHGLEDVTVGVDDLVGTRHGWPPSGAWMIAYNPGPRWPIPVIWSVMGGPRPTRSGRTARGLRSRSS